MNTPSHTDPLGGRNPVKWSLALLLLLGLSFWSFQRHTTTESQSWRGQTMGTTYSIRIGPPGLPTERLASLQSAVEERLDRINHLMSTWDPESEISRFNSKLSTNPIPVDAEFAHVVETALTTARQSGGAFDPTVVPLLEAWGFGPESAPDAPPPNLKQQQHLLRKIGFQKLSVIDGPALMKTEADVQLDLGAVAKGYGVDSVFELLLEHGHSNVLVEIGGEVRALGPGLNGTGWRIGIDRPRPEVMPGEDLIAVVTLTKGALATSGDYRNYRLSDTGELQSHIMDPRTGQPAHHQLGSVSVYAPTCIRADALATALFVLGDVEGPAWIEQIDPAEALFLKRSATGAIEPIASSGFTTAVALQLLDE